MMITPAMTVVLQVTRMVPPPHLKETGPETEEQAVPATLEPVMAGLEPETVLAGPGPEMVQVPEPEMALVHLLLNQNLEEIKNKNKATRDFLSLPYLFAV